MNSCIREFKPYIMRNLILFFTALVLGTTATFATTADDKVAERNAYRNNNSFIFLEDGITFAVYPDGEFDFYIDNRLGNNRRNVTFNSGFDYSPYAQYDDYGAVIQVENIPIFYDFYGRVSDIGSVDINYRNGRVNRLGTMNVFYNQRGFYDYHTGYINRFNRSYVFRPFHSFFARPALGFCFVRTSPYRRYYNPFRYTYYNPYRFNRRNTYAKIGRTHRYNQARQERSRVYRNDKRVAVRENRARNNRTVARSNSARSNRTVARRGDIASNTRNANRVSQKRSNNTAVRSSRNTATNRSRGVSKNSNTRATNSRTVKRTATTTRAPQRKTVAKRTVTKTPRSRTVTRSTTQYRKPQARSTQRTTQKAPSRSRSVQSRSTSSRSVAKAPSRSRNTTARSTSSRSNRSATNSRSRARQ